MCPLRSRIVSTTVGFSPVAPGSSVVTGGVTAAAGASGDSPLGFLDALLAMLAQGTALPSDGQEQSTGTEARTGAEAAANAGLDVLAGLGVAAETAITTQLPAADAPAAVEAPVEPTLAVNGEQLLEDLAAALTAIEDAAANDDPIDPALHKKLSETLDDLAGMLGVTLPTPAAIDPAITAAASGEVAIPSTVELDTALTMESEPLPAGSILAPAEGEATPSPDLAAKFAEAVAQATAPAPVDDEPIRDAAARTRTAADREAEIDPETPLGKLVEKLSEVAEKLATRAPELGAKIEAIVQKIVDKRLDGETLAKLTADLQTADIDLLLAAKAEAKPANPAPTPQLFAAPALPAASAVILPPKQTGEAPSAAVEPLPVETADATEPEQTSPQDLRIARESKPVERLDPEPKVRDRNSFAAHLSEARSDKAEPAQQPAQAAAQVKSDVGVVVPKAVHAAYQAPVQQINAPQVAFEVVRQFNQGNTRFQIRLDPPELGRIDVRMQVDGDGNVHARMTVERAETLDLMQRDQRSLEKALAQAGLDSGKTSLEFSLRQNPFARDGQGQQQHHGGNGSPFAQHRPDADEVPEITSTTTQYRGLASPSGVNLFV